MKTMNREILFRGKTTIKDSNHAFNNTWVMGDRIHSGGKLYIHPIANVVEVNGEIGKLIIMHEVIPSTVGRYTGLTDRNKQKIFEHDVCKDSLGTLFVVEWDAENARFIGFTIENERRIIYISREPRVEVIGNIHDNPDLLGGVTNA